TSNGKVSVTNSTISGNKGYGGIVSSKNATVTNSTISGNTGYGVYALYENITVTNSTISGNESNGVFALYENITVTNSTIVSNTGFGVYARDLNNNGAVVTLNNSLIVGNNSGAGDVSCEQNSASLGTSSNNLVHSSADCLGLAGQVTTATIASIIDPLADNGGDTQTHALVTGSPAIDAGDNANSPGGLTDQRGVGFPRIINGIIDIGSYEAWLHTHLPIISKAAP
ncbi:MAG: right-handed parallel beta-helix repeat-containing protein, partial [Ketobacter sp.]|nr:right-handed parallel beta-helix repeat-containing protein [Ketobacter sp.]